MEPANQIFKVLINKQKKSEKEYVIGNKDNKIGNIFRDSQQNVKFSGLN